MSFGASLEKGQFLALEDSILQDGPRQHHSGVADQGAAGRAQLRRLWSAWARCPAISHGFEGLPGRQDRARRRQPKARWQHLLGPASPLGGDGGGPVPGSLPKAESALRPVEGGEHP